MEKPCGQAKSDGRCSNNRISSQYTGGEIIRMCNFSNLTSNNFWIIPCFTNNYNKLISTIFVNKQENVFMEQGCAGLQMNETNGVSRPSLRHKFSNNDNVDNHLCEVPSCLDINFTINLLTKNSDPSGMTEG